jgi:hypothetical protein
MSGPIRPVILHDPFDRRAHFDQLGATFHMGISVTHDLGVPVPSRQHLQMQIASTERFAEKIWSG